MKKHRIFGSKSLFLSCTALIIISGWEACIRLDAMYKPVAMFFRMAFGENIPLSTAMTYFDWSMFEAPVWLLACMLTGAISLFLIRTKAGKIILLPLGIAMALYGLTRQGPFMTDLWRLIQPAVLLFISVLSGINLFVHQKSGKDKKRRPSAPDNSPRFRDAPRLRPSDSAGKEDRRSA